MNVDNPLTAHADIAAAPLGSSSDTVQPDDAATDSSNRHSKPAVDRGNRLHSMKETQKQKRTSSQNSAHGPADSLNSTSRSGSRILEPAHHQSKQNLRRKATIPNGVSNSNITTRTSGTILPLEVETFSSGEFANTSGELGAGARKRKSMKKLPFQHPFWHHFGSFLASFSTLFRHRFLHPFLDALFSDFWLHLGSPGYFRMPVFRFYIGFAHFNNQVYLNFTRQTSNSRFPFSYRFYILE